MDSGGVPCRRRLLLEASEDEAADRHLRPWCRCYAVAAAG
jgi:hypothetical protein